ncbi:MAG: hypothetical protein JXB85_03535 [Anaerolineales bacterium]|nr:hypothetical protein [Anaerolineales bacterium]
MHCISGKDVIRWYHHLLALPLKGLSAVNLGPLGGENSISVVIETILAQKKGQEVNFPLSKTERFFVQMLTSPQAPPSDPLVEYRALNHAGQREILRRWGKQRLGVIWIGGGVFTYAHPLIAECKPTDWHIWTDANPKVIQTAQDRFEELRKRADNHKVAYNILLPQDSDSLNKNIRFIAGQGVEHIVIQAYGVFYAMTREENLEWLCRLERPAGVEFSFLINAMPCQIDLMPGMLVAFHNQKMIYYESSDIEALFQQALPGSQIVWSVPRKQEASDVEVWLVQTPAGSSLRA